MAVVKSIKKLSNNPIFWIIAFICCISPFALTYMVHYIDELHYTDAAIRMIKTHDYITPYKATGETRFLKPILTYWLITASYSIFGINHFSSRLPFLVCGIITLWITYKIAFKLTENKTISLFAILITASNPLIILSSSRSIPDIPQTLFFTVGLLGITGLITQKTIAKQDLWFFYIGFALAFATKGFPAAIFFVLSFLFLLFNPWVKIKIKSLINWPAIITGLTIAIFWYIIMYILHGKDFISSFYNDQVGGRYSENYFRIVKNFGMAILSIIGYFIFWLPSSIQAIRQNHIKTEKISKSTKTFLVLTLTWLSIFFLLSIFTIKFYDRYLLPVFPSISILIAIIIYGSNSKKELNSLSIINKILLIGGACFSIIAGIITIKLKSPSFSIIYIFPLILFISFIFLHGKNKSTQIKISTTAILLLILSSSILIGTFALPDQGTQIASYLKKNHLKQKDIYYYGSEKVSAKINVACSGNLKIHNIIPTKSDIFKPPAIIIFREDNPPNIKFEEYEIKSISNKWMSYPILDILIKNFNKKTKEKYQIEYKIATKFHK